MKKFLFKKLSGVLRLGTPIIIPKDSKMSPDVLINNLQTSKEAKAKFQAVFTQTPLYRWLEGTSGYSVNFSYDLDTSMTTNIMDWYQPIFYRMRIESIRFRKPDDAVLFRLTHA